MSLGTITTRTLEIDWRDSGVLFIRPVPNTTQESGDVRQNLAVCRELLAGARVPILIDMRAMDTLAREGRVIYATEADFVLGMAMLVDSPFTRIAANLFLRLTTPRQPTRLFTSEDEALEWLRGFFDELRA